MAVAKSCNYHFQAIHHTPGAYSGGGLGEPRRLNSANNRLYTGSRMFEKSQQVAFRDFDGVLAAFAR